MFYVLGVDLVIVYYHEVHEVNEGSFLGLSQQQPAYQPPAVRQAGPSL